MFCNSDSCESAIGVSERPSGPSIMEPFYFLQGPLPLFTGVRGRGILRSSQARSSRNSLAIVHPPGLQLVMQSAETQSLPVAVARRIGIIVGTGSLSRKSRTIRLTNEGFSMK